MGDFKGRIHELIGENETEKAIVELKQKANLLKPSLENDISILGSRLKDNRRNIRVGLESPDENRRELSRIQDAIIKYAEDLDSVERQGLSEDAQAPGKGTFRLLYLVIAIVVVLLVGWYYLSLENAAQRCAETKVRAAQTLELVLETKKANPDIIDEVRFLFWEGTLQNHINLTSCDSLDAINRDIEATKNFLKRYE